MNEKIEKLKYFMRGRKLSQPKIAARLGVSVMVVNNLFNGKRNFGKKSAQAWADAFGLSPLWLMTGEGDMMQNTQPASTGEAVAPPVYYAPLVSKYAYAGYVRGWGDDEYLDSLPKYPIFVDHEPRGQYIAIEVKGDSMDDGSDRSIKEGAVCLCRLIAPEQWHERKVIKHPAAATINSYLRAMLVQLEGAVLEIIRDGRQHGLDVYGVRDLIVEIITPTVADEPTLCDVLGEIISDAAGDGTRGVYTSTLHRVQQYSQRPPRFRDITPEWLQSFDAWLADNGTPSVNARNIHMRNIRAAFNRALNEKRTSADYPFRAFTIKPQPTPAASYTPAELRALFNAAELSPLEAYWLDIFKLSFYFIGINVADLWSLGRVERGRINYTRRKTGRRYSVAVAPEAAEIIARHRGASSLVDMCERYKNTKAATIAANKYLQRIAERLRLPRPTWYTARYSWATIAANDCDAPVEIIALALGHTYGRAVTLGYINPDASKVDRLNREIIALILK